jgi:hypothetical protein
MDVASYQIRNKMKTVLLTICATSWLLIGALFGGGLAEYAYSNGHGFIEVAAAFFIGFLGWPIAAIMWVLFP